MWVTSHTTFLSHTDGEGALREDKGSITFLEVFGGFANPLNNMSAGAGQTSACTHPAQWISITNATTFEEGRGWNMFSQRQ